MSRFNCLLVSITCIQLWTVVHYVNGTILAGVTIEVCVTSTNTIQIYLILWLSDFMFVVCLIWFACFWNSQSPPFLFTNNNQFSGLCVDVLEHIKFKTGLNYSLYLVEDKRYGPEKNSLGLRGLIGDVVYKVRFPQCDTVLAFHRCLFVESGLCHCGSYGYQISCRLCFVYRAILYI